MHGRPELRLVRSVQHVSARQLIRSGLGRVQLGLGHRQLWCLYHVRGAIRLWQLLGCAWMWLVSEQRPVFARHKCCTVWQCTRLERLHSVDGGGSVRACFPVHVACAQFDQHFRSAFGL
jgi:hypothetical protein